MYLRILVPLDGSSASERGVQEALAVADPSWSRLALLHVIDTMPYMLELASQEERCAVLERLRERACEYLESVRKRALERGIKADVALVQIEQGRVVVTVLPGAVSVSGPAESPAAADVLRVRGADRHGFELAIAQRISDRFGWPLELQARSGHENIARIRFPQTLPEAVVRDTQQQ